MKLDIGDKVELIQKGKPEPQVGCVMALPGGQGEGKWTVALEDPDSGTYLFHIPVQPKLIESAGCLLDAMDSKDIPPKEEEKKQSPPKEEEKKEPPPKEEEKKEPPKKEEKKETPPEKEENKSESTTTSKAMTTSEASKSQVNIHPIISGGDPASDSLAKVTQIRKELQAKVDRMRADLENKGVTMKLHQEQEPSEPATKYSPSEPESKYSPSESKFSSEYSTESQVHSPLPPLKPLTDSFKPLPPLPPVEDASLDFSTPRKPTGGLAPLEKFSHPVDGEYAVQSKDESIPAFNGMTHLEVGSTNEETDVFTTLIFTAISCLASATLAGFLISRCNRKGDELNMHLLEEGLVEEDF